MHRAFVHSDALSKSKPWGTKVLVLVDYALNQTEHKCLQHNYDRGHVYVAVCKPQNPPQRWVRYPDGSLCSEAETGSPKACLSPDATRDHVILTTSAHPAFWDVNPSGNLVLRDNITTDLTVRYLRYSHSANKLRLQLCRSQTQGVEQTTVAFAEWRAFQITLLGFDPFSVKSVSTYSVDKNIFELSERYSRPRRNSSVVTVAIRVHVEESATATLPYCARRDFDAVYAGLFVWLWFQLVILITHFLCIHRPVRSIRPAPGSAVEPVPLWRSMFHIQSIAVLHVRPCPFFNST
jgi:hypothetical protein